MKCGAILHFPATGMRIPGAFTDERLPGRAAFVPDEGNFVFEALDVEARGGKIVVAEPNKELIYRFPEWAKILEWK